MFKQKHSPRVWRSALAVLAVAVTAGCASLGQSAKPEDQVVERSNALLQARMSNNFKQAYALTPPGYRAINDYQKFRMKYGNPWALDDGKLVSANCEAERCEVKRGYVTTTPVMPNTQIPIALTEVWIQQDGQWWWFVQ